MTKKLILLVLLAAALTSAAWAMNGYLMFDLRATEKDFPVVSIAGAGFVPHLSYFGINAISTEIASFQDSIFAEIGAGWGWNRCNWILLTGPAFVGGFPGWFGVFNFSSSNPSRGLDFYLKGSAGWNPCNRCDPIYSFEIRWSLETFGCCNCFLLGFARYKAISFYNQSHELWDIALGISPGLRFCGISIYVLTGCESWLKERLHYVGFRIRSLIFPGEIIGKAYLNRNYNKSAVLSGFGLGFNFRL